MDYTAGLARNVRVKLLRPNPVAAEAVYRSEAVMVELAITQPDTQLVIALGREGKVLVKPRDA